MARSGWGAKGLVVLFLLGFFLAAAAPLGFTRPAEAKSKKIVRKVKHKKKLKHKKVVRKAKRKSKAKTKKKPVRLKKKKAPATKKIAAVKKTSVPAAQSSGYDLPAVSGTISQTYAVEEGIGEPEVGNLVGALKSIGAQDAYADTSRNTLTVTFNSSKVTSAGIIKKLKTLGYTAKRQQ